MAKRTAPSASVRTPRGTRSRTLRVTHAQYRDFAEKTKAVGLGLTLSTPERLGCWGEYSPWALPMHDDVTKAEYRMGEHSLITLSFTIESEAFRVASKGRPEVDWSVLHDEEIYPFLMQHEIGHRVDNFCSCDVTLLNDLKARDQCHGMVSYANEVMADRYAWNQIRPGEPLPLTERGRRDQEQIGAAIALLDRHVKRMNVHTCRPLPRGQYRSVPDYMIATAERAEFVGPLVNKALLAQASEYHRQRLANGAPALF